MIEGLKPYPGYQDLKQMWFGDLPTHWRVVPSKSLFGHRKEKARADDKMLTASQSHGIISRDEFMAIERRRVMHVFIGADLLKHVEPNDFVMSMRSFQGGLEWSKVRGAISSAYVMLIPNEHVHPPYFYYLLKTPGYISALRRTSDLVRDGQALRYANFGQVPLPRVPIDEQVTIVRFLDHANRKIDGFIRAKRKLIGLLNEQKQAIIHRAVTRGLHPDVPLKPSGIPWLGDIPKHWEVSPARGLFTEVVERGHAEKQMLSVTIKRGIITQTQLLENSIKKDSSRLDRSAYKLVRGGDIAYNKMRAWQGAFGASALDGIISPAYVVVRPRNGVSCRFFHYLFRTPTFATEAERSSYGIASDMWSLRPEHFRLIKLPVPQFAEQNEIAEYLDRELVRYDTAIARTEREIALMQEYRTRLTADLVTGKLDVREAAAKLPKPPAEAATEEMVEEIETEDESA